MSSDHRVPGGTGSMWPRALLVLGALALLSMGNFLVLQTEVRHQAAYGNAINEAAMLRSTSQDAMLRAVDLAHAPDSGDQARASAELRLTLDRLEATLVSIRASSGQPPPVEVDAVFDQPPTRLHDRAEAFIGTGRAIAAMPPGEFGPDHGLLEALMAQAPPLVHGLDTVVEAYQAQGRALSDRLQMVQFGFFAATLFTVVGAAYFVLRPTFQRVDEEVERLHRTNSDLMDTLAERARSAEARARALARSNEDLERFAYVASHDLQEPIRMVTSYVQLLERRYGEALDEDGREYVGYAVEGAKRMQALVLDLLTYSRIDTDAQAPGPVDLDVVLQAVSSDLQLAVEDAGAEVTWGELPLVQGDAVQMRQLFQNLIENAIKFRGADPPRVRIEHVPREAKDRGDGDADRQACEGGDDRGNGEGIGKGIGKGIGEWNGERTEEGNAEGHGDDNAPHVHLTVTDNGVGIDPAFAERIFVIFQRLDRRGAYPGTGVGLAICKKIVERHNGRIWVEPNETRGSTFHVVLPANRPLPPHPLDPLGRSPEERFHHRTHELV